MNCLAYVKDANVTACDQVNEVACGAGGAIGGGAGSDGWSGAGGAPPRAKGGGAPPRLRGGGTPPRLRGGGAMAAPPNMAPPIGGGRKGAMGPAVGLEAQLPTLEAELPAWRGKPVYRLFIRGNQLSNTTCLTHAFFKGGELMQQSMIQ